MIKINLLPRRVTRKKLTIIRHLVLGVVLVLFTLVVIGYFWSAEKTRIEVLKAQADQAEQETERLKNVNQEKEKHEKNIEDLKHRIDVISQIEKGRTVPIHILDDVTGVLDDTLPIWLTSFNYAQDRVQIDGYSFTNQDIANFVRKLEASPYLMDMELLVSEKAALGNTDLFKFAISGVPESPGGE